MIELREVSKSFGKKEKIKVLDQVSVCLEQGRTIGIMGPSGSGKTTLARIALMLESADTGGVYLQGKKVDRRDRKQMKQFRRTVQYISQHPESFFDPNWTLEKSIMEAAALCSHRKEGEKKLEALLELVKLNYAVLTRFPHQVSGGEIQRAALCRALILEPKVLILDESTSMLDVSVQAQILHVLKEIQERQSLAYLFISHDKPAVFWFSDEVKELRNGKLHG